MASDATILEKLDRMQADIAFLKERLTERLTEEELDAVDRAEDDLRHGRTKDL